MEIEWLKGLLDKSKAKLIKAGKSIRKLGKDDPRRLVHSIKVGMALTLVSLLYYLRPLYDGFGVAGMWAVLTVVVVFEFTVGGTMSRCLNRGFATLVAGALGVGAQHFAFLFGETGEPIVLGILVFLLAATSTFIRFIPQIKARFDYGVLVFILTFSLVAVSGYRVEEILEMAQQRLSTIFLGGVTCVVVSTCIYPVWAGEELHRTVTSNIDNLANYLEGFGSQYFQISDEGARVEIFNNTSLPHEYKNLLGSKSTEEVLANLARWEPRHGHFGRKHPWKQYLKIGAMSRQCAYQIEALNAHISSNLQVCPHEFQSTIQESCKKMCEASSKALRLLTASLKTMTHPTCANAHVESSKTAIQELELAIKALCSIDSTTDLLAIIPIATIASILIEIVYYVEKLSQTIHEFSHLAHFKAVDSSAQLPKNTQLRHRCSINPIVDGVGDDHVIEIEEKFNGDTKSIP